jgi:hypothetical protein
VTRSGAEEGRRRKTHPINILRTMSGGKVDVVLSERQVDVDGSTVCDVSHQLAETAETT